MTDDTPTFKLKPLSLDAVPAALEKAERYRLLNEPMEAESICRDILRLEPANHQALVTLVLALTDQLEEHPARTQQAREALARFADDYSRSYYHGILCERRAKAHFKRGGPHAGYGAYNWLREAMDHYEKAAELRPEHDDSAILRWNTCVRILRRHPELRPAPEDSFQPLLE
jgi:tetratricopeptide (TPR) repeat protein